MILIIFKHVEYNQTRDGMFKVKVFSTGTGTYEILLQAVLPCSDCR
jgi:hypothetical protein